VIPGSQKRRFTALDAVLIILIVGGVVLLVRRVRTDLVYNWDWSIIPQYLFRREAESGRPVAGALILGVFTTIRLTIWSALGALVIGTLVGVLRISKNRGIQLFGRIYTEAVRNTPPLVLIFIFFYFVGNQLTVALGIDSWIRNAGPATQQTVRILFSEPQRFAEFLSAVFTLAVYEGAYMAEIIRAGVQSVPRGQVEAAQSLGLRRVDQYRFVILPQALRTIGPALAGQLISTVKDSAIVAVISVQELTFRGLELMSATFRTFEVWITITALYLLLTGALSIGARALERRMTRTTR
jgi:polar amino acid transport system permease protein